MPAEILTGLQKKAKSETKEQGEWVTVSKLIRRAVVRDMRAAKLID